MNVKRKISTLPLISLRKFTVLFWLSVLINLQKYKNYINLFFLNSTELKFKNQINTGRYKNNDLKFTFFLYHVFLIFLMLSCASL